MKQTELTVVDPNTNKDKEVYDKPVVEAAPVEPPKQTEALSKWEGYRVLLGGVLVHFVLGTFYLWGGISLYVASYLRVNEPNLDIDTVKLVFPFMMIMMNSVISFGIKIAEKIGTRALCFIGVGLIALATLIVSFIQSFIPFLLIYAILVGLSCGLLYMAPVVVGWKYFPGKKGLVSGCIVAGFGFGSFTFNLIATAIVNPDNVVASVKYGNSKYFTEDVYSRVPMMLRYLALLDIIIGLIGVALMKDPKKPTPPPVVKQQPNDQQNVASPKVEVRSTTAADVQQVDSVMQGIKSMPFWILMIMVIAGSFFGLLMANNYKVFGMSRLGNDQFVTIVGSIGSAANGCSRLFWAFLLDKFGFKKVYVSLIFIQTVICGTLYVVSDISALYLIWYALTMATEGGQFSVMPAVSAKVFGSKKGALIYGFLFFGFALSNLLAFLLTKFGLADLGWPNIFWICFGLSVLSLVLGVIFKEKHNFPKPLYMQANVTEK